MSSEPREDVSVTLAVRTLAPDGGAGRQAEVIERLRAMEQRGTIDDLTVEVWGKRVGLTTADAETDHGRAVVETVESFREWADRHDRSIGTFFETRRVENEFTDTGFTALELPSMAMAEYREGDLAWVSPSLDVEADAVSTVRDRIDRLAAERDAATAGAETPPAAPTVAEE